MKYFDAFLDNAFGIETIKERPFSHWIKTIDNNYYEEIASEIEFIRTKRVERENKGNCSDSKIGELVYHLDTNEIIYYIFNLENKRRFKIKQNYYLKEVNPQLGYDITDFQYHDDFLSNFKERALLKKSKDILKHQPVLYDTQTNEEIDYCSLILFIINKYRLGSAYNKEYWNRCFNHIQYEYDRVLVFHNDAERNTSQLFYQYMKYKGKVDLLKAEIIFDYIEFGFEKICE